MGRNYLWWSVPWKSVLQCRIARWVPPGKLETCQLSTNMQCYFGRRERMAWKDNAADDVHAVRVCQKHRTSPAVNGRGECLAELRVPDRLQQTVGCTEWCVAPIDTRYRDLICQGTLESVPALGRKARELDHGLPLAIRHHVERPLFGEDDPVAIQVGQALVIRIGTAPQGQQPDSVAKVGEDESIRLLTQQCVHLN